MFKSENENSNSKAKGESLTILENIFTAKSVGVTANYVILFKIKYIIFYNLI